MVGQSGQHLDSTNAVRDTPRASQMTGVCFLRLCSETWALSSDGNSLDLVGARSSDRRSLSPVVLADS
jgi:hypothetical protein